MKINTNRWNKIRYTLYTPSYNLLVSFFNNSRKKSIDSLKLKSGDKVLIIGAGTGLDLQFILNDCEIIATDITPAMVEKIKECNKSLNRNVQALIMDGHCLEFLDNTFDAVILHLILAVIPDPIRCIKETERVLKPGGKVVVYDKFLRKGRKVTIFHQLANIVANTLFSDITRNFESILSNSKLTVLSDEAADFNGYFRLIMLTNKI
jgi:phosphatidylethanolamine/phosphatidyl-N-methylethanolamine N-methyltransferase